MSQTFALSLLIVGLVVVVLLLLRECAGYQQKLRDATERLARLEDGLEDIAESAELPCGCVPCMGACYGAQELREEMGVIHRRAKHALRS